MAYIDMIPLAVHVYAACTSIFLMARAGRLANISSTMAIVGQGSLGLTRKPPLQLESRLALGFVEEGLTRDLSTIAVLLSRLPCRPSTLPILHYAGLFN